MQVFNNLPSHASSKNPIHLTVVGKERADATVGLQLFLSGSVAQARDGVFTALHKIESYQGLELPTPTLSGLVKNVNVQFEIGPEIVAHVGAARSLKQSFCFQPHVVQVVVAKGLSGQVRFPSRQISRQSRLVEDFNRGQNAKRKVGFALFQPKELAKFTKVGGGSQKFGNVAKEDALLGADGGHPVTPSFQFWSTPRFVEMRHQILRQQDMVIAGTKKCQKKLFVVA